MGSNGQRVKAIPRKQVARGNRVAGLFVCKYSSRMTSHVTSAVTCKSKQTADVNPMLV